MEELSANNYRPVVEAAFHPMIAAAGLEVTESRYDRSFGNFFVHFDSSSIRLKLVRDRMQFRAEFAAPNTDFAAENSGEWIDDETIFNLLGQDVVAEELRASELKSLDKLASALTKHFGSILALFSAETVGETLREAGEYRRDRAKRLFGYIQPP